MRRKIVMKNRRVDNRIADRLRPLVAAGMVAMVTMLLFAVIPTSSAQDATTQSRSPQYPKEIRGYKVELAKVEIKRSKKQAGSNSKANDSGTSGDSDEPSPDADALIEFGKARISGMTPLGITLEVPITVAAVKQKGHVDFLSFENMIVNGLPVTLEDYKHSFDLPTNKAFMLPEPVRIFISTPTALLGAMGEWGDSKQTWPVTGRVYVFGRFKKFLFNFKRVVPVELEASLPNPLIGKKEVEGMKN